MQIINEMRIINKIFTLLLLVFLLAGFGGCANSVAAEIACPPVKQPKTAEAVLQKPQFAWQWPQDLPENHGISNAALARFHSELDEVNVLAAVIVKDDYIIDEYYKPGYDENSLFIMNSASKSLTSALIGIAIDKGYIDSVDVPVGEFFPELENSGITIWHLLTHTSGLASTDDVRWDAWRNSTNWLDYIFNLPVVAEPGTEFSYSTGNTHLLAAILEQATGMGLYDFAKENLFAPLGMRTARIDTDPQGIGDGGNGIWLNVYDMAKFGSLYLHNGQWQGRQVIPADWVQASTTLQYDRSTGSADYGYQWWVRTFGEARHPAYFAQGHAGQYIFVVPDLQLIIVFTSDYPGSSSIYWQFVNDIVAACD